MLKAQVEQRHGGRVILMDSITKLAPKDAGAIVVCASHGGVSAAEVALVVPLRAVFFNDAGIGKDNAGIVARDMLEARSVAAGTVGSPVFCTAQISVLSAIARAISTTAKNCPQPVIRACNRALDGRAQSSY